VTLQVLSNPAALIILNNASTAGFDNNHNMDLRLNANNQ
jgi:hypothetical protein